MNMRSSLYAIVQVALLSAPAAAQQVESDVPVNNSFIAFTIPEKDLLPENVAYDPVTETFYVGSTRKGKILSVDRMGNVTEFVGSREHGLWMVIGMKVDAERRHLWAASSGGDNLVGYDREGSRPAGVFKFDLATGDLIQSWTLDGPNEVHFFNDLVLNDEGDVFVTHMFDEAAIYTIPHDTQTLELFARPEGFSFPNGIDITDDGQTLLVAHGEGLSAFEVATGTQRAVQYDGTWGDSDGLYYYDSSVVVVESNERRVRRYFLDGALERVTRAEVLEANHPMFNSPTTGVLVEDTLYYIANAQFGSFDEDGSLFPLERLFEVVVLRLPLRP